MQAEMRISDMQQAKPLKMGGEIGNDGRFERQLQSSAVGIAFQGKRGKRDNTQPQACIRRKAQDLLLHPVSRFILIRGTERSSCIYRPRALTRIVGYLRLLVLRASLRASLTRSIFTRRGLHAHKLDVVRINNLLPGTRQWRPAILTDLSYHGKESLHN